MTPAQKNALATARRFGLTGSLLVAVAGWGFKSYDATNAKAVRVEAIRDSIVARRSLDSLTLAFRYQQLHELALRTDSAVRKVCLAIKAGC
jgi:hypothetical protein